MTRLRCNSANSDKGPPRLAQQEASTRLARCRNLNIGYGCWVMPITLDDLRRFAVARSLFKPTTLRRALERLGFVQADPIRAPARAQDLTLRHRVKDYRAGDLERRYSTLGVEEEHFINYGFVTGTVQALMHPRGLASRWPAGRKKRAQSLLEFVRERGAVHPREVDRRFSHGTVTNYWGGPSRAPHHLLET